MNRKLTVVVTVIVFVVGAGFAYLLLGGKPDTSSTSVAPPKTTAQTAPPAKAVDTVPGRYIDYSETALADATGTKILFFHASWCPQCRALETDIKSNQVPDGVTILKVDYDTNQALRQKYGVKLQTTLVRVDDSGAEVEKFVAYDEPSLQAVVKNLL